MKIFFNSTFKEIERDASDSWVKGNTGNRLEAYFEELDLTNSNINARLTIEWGNGKTTTEIPMNKSFGFKYVYLTLPTLLESGEVKFTIGVYQNETLLQTAIFTRKIKASVEASDKVPIDATEYEALMNLIKDLNNNREISLTNIDGKPALLSEEKLDVVSYESVNNALDKMIEELTRLNDNNLFDPTGLENAYRYRAKFTGGIFELLENGTVVDSFNLETFVNSSTSKYATAINDLKDKDLSIDEEFIDVKARLSAIEASGGGSSGGSGVDLTDYYTKLQADKIFASLEYVNSQIDQYYPKVYLDEVFATKNHVEQQLGETQQSNLNTFVLKTVLTELYDTSSAVDEKIYNATKDLFTKNLANESFYNKNYINTNFYDKTQVDGLIANFVGSDYVNQKVAETYTKIDANALFSTKQYVNDQFDSLYDTYLPYQYTKIEDFNFLTNKTLPINYVTYTYLEERLEELETGDVDLSGYLQKPVDNCTEDTQILIGNTDGTLEYSTLTIREINGRLESLESNSGSGSSGGQALLFEGSASSGKFSNFTPSKLGFLLFNGRLSSEEDGNGDFQAIFPITTDFLNGTTTIINISRMVYGYEQDGTQKVTVSLLGDGYSNNFQCTSNCVIKCVYHFY